jgi:polysaccharide export outer membrane protein
VPPADPVPRECAKEALPPYVIEPPDILLVESTVAVGKSEQPITGQHLVRPDGTIELGIYGTVFVAGMTLEQAKAAIVAQLVKRNVKVTPEQMNVDVLAYNSKFCYVITDGGGWGAQIYRLPITGNDTVLDALAQVGGLPPVASKKAIWLARPSCNDPNHPKVLPIDWCGLVQQGSAATNYQLFPGDRIFVQSDARLRLDAHVTKTLTPIDRGLGAVLLGASTVNAIRLGSSSSGSGLGGLGVVR